MYRKIAKVVLVMVCLGVCGVGAKGDTVAVGLFSFDDLSLGVGSGATYGLDVTNYTGGGGSDVVTELAFGNLALTVTFADASVESGVGLTGDGFGDFSTGELFAGNVESAVLAGTFSPETVTLADGSVVAIGGMFSATLTDALGSLMGGDYTYINVSTSPIAAGWRNPERAGACCWGWGWLGRWRWGGAARSVARGW